MFVVGVIVYGLAGLIFFSQLNMITIPDDVHMLFLIFIWLFGPALIPTIIVGIMLYLINRLFGFTMKKVLSVIILILVYMISFCLIAFVFRHSGGTLT